MTTRRPTPEYARTIHETPAIALPDEMLADFVEQYRLLCEDAIAAFKTPAIGAQREVIYRMLKLNADLAKKKP
jgi:hypothetical protein